MTPELLTSPIEELHIRRDTTATNNMRGAQPGSASPTTRARGPDLKREGKCRRIRNSKSKQTKRLVQRIRKCTQNVAYQGFCPIACKCAVKCVAVQKMLVQCAVCSVQCAVCNVQCAVCSASIFVVVAVVVAVASGAQASQWLL